MINLKQSVAACTAIFSAAAMIALLAISPAGSQPLQAQAAPAVDAAKTAEAVGMPWWRVRQLKHTIADADGILNVGNRLFVKDLQVNEATQELVVLGVIDWEDVDLANNRPLGRHLDGIAVSMELFYKTGRLGDVSDTRDYMRIATVSANSQGSLISESTPRGITRTMGGVNFRVKLEDRDAAGKVTPLKLMPGEYQIKLTVYVSSQTAELQEKMLAPAAMVREEALHRYKARFMESPHALLELKQNDFFDGVDGRIWSDNLVSEWGAERKPLRTVLPKNLASMGFAALSAEVVKYIDQDTERQRQIALVDLKKGNIKISAAFAKFYYRPEGYQPKPGEKAFERDRIFFDNGSLEASSSLARLVYSKERLSNDNACWSKRLTIWRAKAVNDSWVAPAKGSQEDRDLDQTAFFDLPGAKARALRCESRLSGFAENIKIIDEELAMRRALIRVTEGIDEDQAVLNADQDRIATVRDTYQRFDDPLLYGMSEIIYGDFAYWRWRVNYLYNEVFRTLYYDRTPWERGTLDPQIFGADPKTLRVPTNQSEWLEYLYAKAVISTRGSLDKTGVLIPGQTKAHSGGVYSEKILERIKLDLFGADGKAGGEDDFNLMRFLTPGQDRKILRIFSEEVQPDGTKLITSRDPSDEEKTTLGPDNRKYMPGKGMVLRELTWVAEEKRFREQMGFVDNNASAQPLKFVPFDKSFDVNTQEFTPIVRLNSTVGRIQALSTAGKYFPTVGRYQREVDALLSAAEALSYALNGIRHEQIRVYGLRGYEYAQEGEVIDWDAQTGLPTTSRTSRRAKFVDGRPVIENGKPVLEEVVRILHPNTPLAARFDTKTLLDRAAQSIESVSKFLKLDISYAGFREGQLTRAPVFANWYFQVGPGRVIAEGVIEVRPALAVTDVAAIEARLKAARAKAAAAARAAGGPALAAWLAKEKTRQEYEKMLKEDPDECPYKRSEAFKKELSEKAKDRENAPVEATRAETAKMGLRERFLPIPDLIKVTDEGPLVSEQSGGVGDKDGS